MTGDYNFNKMHKEMLTGLLDNGDLSGTFDFGNGSRITFDFKDLANERLRELEIEERHDFFDHNGRIMMFNLGII